MKENRSQLQLQFIRPQTTRILLQLQNILF